MFVLGIITVLPEVSRLLGFVIVTTSTSPPPRYFHAAILPSRMPRDLQTRQAPSKGNRVAACPHPAQFEPVQSTLHCAQRLTTTTKTIKLLKASSYLLLPS